jgi:hypothetical protein
MPNVKIEITVTANSVDGFTAAELTCISGDERHFLGRVFEREDGWHYETVMNENSFGILLEPLASDIDKAKEALRPYVNRMGVNPPPGLTMAEFSLLLLAKKDAAGGT